MEVIHERHMMLNITDKEGRPLDLRERLTGGHLLPGDTLTIDGTEWLVFDSFPGKALIWQRTNVRCKSEFESKNMGVLLDEYYVVKEYTDEFFLPTEEQIRTYLTTNRERIAYDSYGCPTCYWLGDKPDEEGDARYVYIDGSISKIKAEWGWDYGIAPACWLRADSNK